MGIEWNWMKLAIVIQVPLLVESTRAMNTVTAERAIDVCTFVSMEARYLYTAKCMLNPLRLHCFLLRMRV